MRGETIMVRRLWPAADEAVGGPIELPAARAGELIAAAAAIPVTSPVDGPPGDQPLAGAILHRLAHDPELAGLWTTASAYVSRPARADPARRQSYDAWRRYVERVVFVALPRTVGPAAFTQAAVAAEFASRPSYARAADGRAVLIAHLIRRRRCAILAEMFDDLRAGRLVVTGIAVGDGGKRALLPPDIWGSPSLTFDLIDNAVLAGTAMVFMGVETSQPVRPLPEATARAFLARFAAEVADAGRLFSNREAAAGFRRAFPASAPSTRQITKLLQETRPPAWSNNGRRLAGVIPTAAELDAATRVAQAAAEKTSH